MKTALQQVMEDLRKNPLEMVSQKSIADWLQACYLKIEKEQIGNAWIDGYYSGPIDSSEDYYNETYDNKG